MTHIMSDGAGTARSSEAVPGGRAPAAGGDVDGKFDELAGAVFEHCRNQLTNEQDDDESFYPIAEQQQKRKLEQQLSSRCVLVLHRVRTGSRHFLV